MSLIPLKIELNQEKNRLILHYADNHYALSAEFMRVHSPSAEVRGHSPEQAILQLNKSEVLMKKIAPVGNYAIRIDFDDGHNTGIYSWDYLHHLSVNQIKLWSQYQEKVAAALKNN